MRHLAIAVFSCVVACGCASETDKATQVELSNQLSKLKTDLQLANLSIKLLQTQMTDSVHERNTTFEPNQKGYGRIYSDNGLFLVSLQDLKPYANGYKATINFGNPQAVAFDDVEVDLAWGPVFPKDPKLVDKWEDSFQRTTQKLGKQLQGGKWNPVDIILAPATSEQVGRIEIVALRTPSVFLRY